MERPAIGDHVIFVDQVGQERDALVTAVFGSPDDPHPPLNLVVVHKESKYEDSYGRQIDRNNTSVVHETNQSAPGFFWRAVASPVRK